MEEGKMVVFAIIKYRWVCLSVFHGWEELVPKIKKQMSGLSISYCHSLTVKRTTSKSSALKQQSSIFTHTSAGWAQRGLAQRSALPVSPPSWTSRLPRVCYPHGDDQEKESSPAVQVHFKPLLVSLLLISLWPKWITWLRLKSRKGEVDAIPSEKNCKVTWQGIWIQGERTWWNNAVLYEGIN